jgi:hypothetical protein
MVTSTSTSPEYFLVFNIIIGHWFASICSVYTIYVILQYVILTRQNQSSARTPLAIIARYIHSR